MNVPDLTDEQAERYARNILLPQVGEAGQRGLLDSGVLVVGAGGLGSAALLYLAAAGVGRLGIADADRLERSNLNRQVIHRASDLGRPKAESAADAVRARNPDCAPEVLTGRLSAENVRATVRRFDLVLDCTDNFPTRFLVADACWLEKRPLVSAAVVRFEGQLLTVLPEKGRPCYRCFIPEPPPPGTVPTADVVGILGAVAGTLGALQVTEALKVLLGLGHNLAHRLLIYDGLEATFRTVDRPPDPACPLCGPKPTITDVGLS